MRTGLIVLNRHFPATDDKMAMTSFNICEYSSRGAINIRCVAFGDTADWVAKHAGARVQVSGQSRPQSYTSAFGEVNYSELVVDELQIVGSSDPAASAGEAAVSENAPDPDLVSAKK